MNYLLAIVFNDLPNVIHIIPFKHAGASVVELKFPVVHPRKNKELLVYYRGTSSKGKRIYYYSEGNRAGEVLGG